jgi:hypothetical protein
MCPELLNLVHVASLLLSCALRSAKDCLLLMLIVPSGLYLNCSRVGSEARVPDFNVCPRQPSLHDINTNFTMPHFSVRSILVIHPSWTNTFQICILGTIQLIAHVWSMCTLVLIKPNLPRYFGVISYIAQSSTLTLFHTLRFVDHCAINPKFYQLILVIRKQNTKN